LTENSDKPEVEDSIKNFFGNFRFSELFRRLRENAVIQEVTDSKDNRRLRERTDIQEVTDSKDNVFFGRNSSIVLYLIS